MKKNLGGSQTQNGKQVLKALIKEYLTTTTVVRCDL